VIGQIHGEQMSLGKMPPRRRLGVHIKCDRRKDKLGNEPLARIARRHNYVFDFHVSED
jgi:hypothetical protein